MVILTKCFLACEFNVEVQGGKVVRVRSWGVGQGGEEVGMTIALLVDQRGLREGRVGEGMSFVLGEEGG